MTLIYHVYVTLKVIRTSQNLMIGIICFLPSHPSLYHFVLSQLFHIAFGVEIKFNDIR